MPTPCLTVLVVLVTFVQPPVDYPTDLEKWYATDPPEEFSAEWSVANGSTYEWAVSLGDAGPRVKRYDWRQEPPSPLPFKIEPGKDLSGRMATAKVEDGWIVGFDQGEWGGGLWWFSPTGARRVEIMPDVNVVRLLPTKAGLLALEGIAHGVEDKGRILRVYRDPDGRWQVSEFLGLGHAPRAVDLDADGSLIVATSRRLLRISLTTKRVEILVNNAFWRYFYPNSLVRARSGAIFVGMGHGVARVEKAGISYRVRWLLPSQAFAKQKNDEGFR